MSGSVGIIASDTGRYTLFSVCLTQLRHPPNTNVDWALSPHIAEARNTLVRRSLDAGSEWILFLDDDHVYPSDLLMRLLAHEQDIVCSLYLRRAKPFAPVAFSHRSEDGLYHSIDLTTLPNEGLLKIKAVKKPAQPARKNVPNPFKPGEFMDIPAKPASVKVKSLPLKRLKEMVK